jgi:hypothetical protein
VHDNDTMHEDASSTSKQGSTATAHEPAAMCSGMLWSLKQGLRDGNIKLHTAVLVAAAAAAAAEILRNWRNHRAQQRQNTVHVHSHAHYQCPTSRFHIISLSYCHVVTFAGRLILSTWSRKACGVYGMQCVSWGPWAFLSGTSMVSCNKATASLVTGCCRCACTCSHGAG